MCDFVHASLPLGNTPSLSTPVGMKPINEYSSIAQGLEPRTSIMVPVILPHPPAFSAVPYPAQVGEEACFSR